MPETLTDAQKVFRNDTGKRIAVALEALASEVDPSTAIAPEYDETQTYAVGDLVIYRSVLYRCTTAITTPEDWTAAHWSAVTVADELADKYVKPTGGIPKNDLADGVQESLNKADTALQQHQSLAAYRTAADQDVIDSGLRDAINAITPLDTAPTEGSTKGITGGAVYSAINANSISFPAWSSFFLFNCDASTFTIVVPRGFLKAANSYTATAIGYGIYSFDNTRYVMSGTATPSNIAVNDSTVNLTYAIPDASLANKRGLAVLRGALTITAS